MAIAKWTRVKAPDTGSGHRADVFTTKVEELRNVASLFGLAETATTGRIDLPEKNDRAVRFLHLRAGSYLPRSPEGL